MHRFKEAPELRSFHCMEPLKGELNPKIKAKNNFLLL